MYEQIDIAHAQSIKNQQPQVIIRETESAIKSLLSNALALANGSSVSGDVQEKYNSLKSVIFSYLTFDDVLLSQVVVDEEVHKERSELANFFDSLSQKTKRDLFAEITALLTHVNLPRFPYKPSHQPPTDCKKAYHLPIRGFPSLSSPSGTMLKEYSAFREHEALTLIN